MILIGTPHAKGSGYYLNDDTNSGGQKAEADIRTCTHCQCVIKMQEWKDDGAFCRKCNAPICAHCGDRALVYGCEPFLMRLERFTNAVVKYRQHLKVAGLEPGSPPKELVLP
jgi:hypothetical protein